MPVVSTNNAANAALNFLNSSTSQEAGRVAQLASGSRIVQASDDAAGLAIGTQLQATVAVFQQDLVNVAQGTSILQTADAGLAQINNVLQRMMALATEAASGQVTSVQRNQDLDTEYQQLMTEINQIASGTQYAGMALLSGPSAVAGGAFSFLSNSILTHFYEAQIMRNAQFGATNDHVILDDATGLRFSYNQAIVDEYAAGAHGLPGGTSGSFNSFGLAAVNGPAFGSANFMTGTSSRDAISVAINSINTESLGMEKDVITYSDSPVLTVWATARTPSGSAITVNESTSTYLAANPDGSFPGQIAVTENATYRSNIATQSAALSSMSVVDAAIKTVTRQRAVLGGYESQFQFSAADISTNLQNTSAADSVIMDADVAQVKAALSANDVRTQAAVAALTQAAQLPMELLKLVRT